MKKITKAAWKGDNSSYNFIVATTLSFSPNGFGVYVPISKVYIEADFDSVAV